MSVFDPNSHRPRKSDYPSHTSRVVVDDSITDVVCANLQQRLLHSHVRDAGFADHFWKHYLYALDLNCQIVRQQRMPWLALL